MPKIQRKTQKIFCNSADSDQIAVFGTMSTGTPVYSNDIEQLQSNEAYEIGWDAATLEDKAPFMEEMNGMQYAMSYQLAYTLQTGMPEWDAETEYFANTSFCQVNGVIYQSKTDNNIGNNPTTDSTNWALYGSGNYLTTSQITNCLLEVPQNIKLELNNGVLTLKAGSKVYVPNGFEADGTTPKFDEIVIESDISRNSFSTNGVAMVFVNFNDSGHGNIGLGQALVANVGSGTSDPNTGYYYRTNENKLYITGNWYGYSLPICIGTTNGTTITSIEQTFNGFGYVGSTIWVDKGIKGLIPNGRNEDGSLKNIEFITNKVSTFTYDFGISIVNDDIWLSPNGNIGRLQKEYIFTVNTFGDLYSNTGNNQYRVAYVIEDNLHYMTSDTGVSWEQLEKVSITTCNTSLNKITSLQPKQPFRAVDYSDLQSGTSFKTVVNTYQNGNSWYRVWSDGWKEQGSLTGGINIGGTITVTLLKAFTNANYTLLGDWYGTSAYSIDDNPSLFGKTTSSFQIYASMHGANDNYNLPVHWYACGY